MISFILTDNNLTLFIEGEGKPRILPTDKKPVKEIIDLIKQINSGAKELLDKFYELITPAKLIALKTDNRFKVNDSSELYYYKNEDRAIPEFFAKKILEFIDKKIDVDYLIKFWENCIANPRPEAINELFDFLSANHYPITDDGCFIGYKKVTSKRGYESTPKEFEGLYVDKQGFVRNSSNRFVGGDLRQQYLEFISNNEPTFVDSHSRTIEQKIGDVVKMDRNLCDPDAHNTCSTGYHVGSYDYSSSFSGDVFIYVKVNPMNVTAVPHKYDAGKLRCCEYQIMGFAESDNQLTADVVDFCNEEEC